MLDSTMELITLVSSNSLIIFFICNLIIVTLLLTGSKLDSPPPANDQAICSVVRDIKRIEKQKKEEEEEEDQEGENVSLPQTIKRIEKEEEDQGGENVSLPQTIKRIEKEEEEEVLVYNDIEASHDTVQASIDNVDSEGFSVIDNNNNIDDDEHEDELRKRAEKFIEKINRRWKEEKFGNSQYLERQNLNNGFTRIPVM